MNVHTMTMPKETAREKLRAYRSQLHKRADAEYAAIEQGYAALAQGKALLNLSEVIAAAPTDEKGRPRLAVARSDRQQVRFNWESNRAIAEFSAQQMDRWGNTRNAPSTTLVRNVNMGREYVRKTNDDPYRRSGYALLPIVPADVREKVCGQLKDFYTLWEVEQWAEAPIRATPDRDPYLLRHLGGELYTIEAEWDLTDLERAIMAGRAQS